MLESVEAMVDTAEAELRHAHVVHTDDIVAIVAGTRMELAALPTLSVCIVSGRYVPPVAEPPRAKKSTAKEPQL